MRKLLILLIVAGSIAIAKPPSVTIAIPAESWDLCQAVWPARQMDAALGSHPRRLTASGDTVVVVVHRWSPGDMMRIAQMRADYGWPAVVSRDTLSRLTEQVMP